MMIRMPGSSYRGALAPLTDAELTIRDSLEQDVGVLACRVGERNLFRYEGLQAARAMIDGELETAGYRVRHQEFEVEGRTCSNLEVRVTVFSGHDHDYERTIPQRGVTYVVTGGGRIKPVGSSEFTAVSAAELHFMLVTVTDDAMKVTAIDTDGKVLDSFSPEPRSGLSSYDVN